MNPKSENLPDSNIIGLCNFYDVEENTSCYQSAIIREDANYRMLCGKHYKKYKKILLTRDADSFGN